MTVKLQSQVRVLGVDWGTSNRRAYLLSRGGALLSVHEDDQGLLAVQGRFAASMRELRERMGVGVDTPAILSGMVGSASGWQEVPYLDTSVPLRALGRQLVAVREAPENRIVPGYCARGAAVDVMRGEETQLLGALTCGLAGVDGGWVVLPGTHSKWVLLENGHIAQLKTFMTGELFKSLCDVGTLAPLMRASPAGDEEEAGFAAGVAAARNGLPLSQALFGVRAHVVAGAMPAAWARPFLSGLLIGTEFAAIGKVGHVHMIGSPQLVRHYGEVAAQCGVAVGVLDAHEIFRAALIALSNEDGHGT